MKIITSLLSFSVLVLLSACGAEKTEATTDTSANAVPGIEAPPPPPVPVPVDYATTPETIILPGTWEGTMNGKKLTIVIEKVEGNTIEGYNILGTNKRALKGTFVEGAWDQPCAKAVEATLAEPGDDKWDGVFTVKFVGYEDEKETENGPECAGNLKGVEAQGEWKSNNGKSTHIIALTKSK